MIDSIVWIWLTGALFALFHSFTASQGCKQCLYGLGLKEPHYRLTYSTVSLLTTLLWAWYIHHLADVPLYHIEGWLAWFFIGVQIIGGLIALAAFAPIDGLVFLGLRKGIEHDDPFVVRGIYRWVRHPMYTGAMLFLLAMPEQTWNGLNFTLVLCLYFIIGSRLEEKRMLKIHPSYAVYQRTVPAFIPKRPSAKKENK
ncbi:MAG: isoprenylcysteine carboxylmethyltransferase family protein [Mariprofundaceae bacterium]|nr:isoprenylcysteine carboxylmethyltransferase family protein [Mariprofundaceae bacterium]